MQISPASLTLHPTAEGQILVFTGVLDAASTATLWPILTRALNQKISAIDLSGVEAMDSAGAVLVLNAGAELPVHGASPVIAAVLERNRTALAAAPPILDRPFQFQPVTALGAIVVEGFRAALSGITFTGQALVTALGVIRRPRLFRFGELLRHLDEVGLRAFPLTVLLGFLIGLILAYQSSIPLKRFGAEVFVPNLVGISLLRELGPLLAGVVLAGRTGSAFAAELGTMTVNEEIDALRIMGIDPMAMLVLPRMLAAVLVMPVLTLVMNFAGLAGMTVVMDTLGFPWSAVSNQLQQWLKLGDLVGGLFKSGCFGLIIAGIGCRAGLAAGRGPRAVGDAATAAVVGGIVAIVAMDGIFAILFFRLGI